MMGIVVVALVLCVFLKESLTKEALLTANSDGKTVLVCLEHPSPDCSAIWV